MEDYPVSENILIQAIEHSNLAHTVSSVGGDHELIYVNQAFLDQTGYQREEVIGRNCRFLQGDETDPETVQKIREAIVHATPLSIEILNYKKDGTPFWNFLKMSPVFDASEKLVAFIGIQSDVTAIRERDRVERERKKLEALGRMSANISHEIKNALQPVKLMSDVLSDWDAMSQEQMSKTVTIIQDNVGIAENIVQDVLRFSRKAERGLQVTDVNNLFHDTVRFVKNTLIKTVVFECQNKVEDKGLSVKVHQSEFFQIVMNLVNNAVYAMKEKGQLSMTFSQENECLCISLQDTGCGMDEKTVSMVFDPFFSTKPVGEGTGLGLSVCHRLIKAWGGDITLTSRLNEGTEFRILIPVVDDLQPS